MSIGKPLPAAPSRTASADTIEGNTIAQLYAVFGLPKDPAVWTLAEEDCTEGVHHIEGAVGRFWRPEVLGCSVCPPVSQMAADTPMSPSSSSSRKPATSEKKGSNPKFIEMAASRGEVCRVETAQVLSKALKLSFTRDVEITSGRSNFPPSSTCHTFSFSISASRTESRSDIHRQSVLPISNGFSGNHRHETTEQITFFGSVLTVWSAADEKRAQAIKKELNRLAKARAVQTRSRSASRHDRKGSEGGSAFSDALTQDNSTFFMPYAICIVSRYPLYNLLGDWNKYAWFKYSRNIDMHNKQMAAILRYPAPRIGESLRLPCPDQNTAFVCRFPGALDWGRGLLGVDFSMWPLFKTLSVDHILSICEIALAAGRILFMSRHSALMGTAVETIKYLVEFCGWKGMTHQNCHARDVRIYLEDPGTWLVAINTELRSIIKPPREVCVVDLDINFVKCPHPPANALSTGTVRDKKRRKLIATLGTSSLDYGVPREYVEAFPGGCLQPLSTVESRSGEARYESLHPPYWWDQNAILAAFEQVLQQGTRPSKFKKLLKMPSTTQITASETETAAVHALRTRASIFVDARDGLENKIGRLNKRLAFLMKEGDVWRQQFDQIQQLVDRLTREAGELRTKLDKERRESRRLTSTMHRKDLEHVQVQLQLRETEQARQKAQGELARMREAMDNLESEREAMVEEIQSVLSSSAPQDFRFSSNWHSHRSSQLTSPGGSDLSHNTEAHILKARALAEQRISMGPQPHSDSQSKIRSSPIVGVQNENVTASSTHSHFPDHTSEIHERTMAVTDQISRIQQQLESTLISLEGRKSVDQHRRRLSSSSSIASSYRYEHQGPPSSLGHHNGTTSSVGHGHASETQHEAIETMDGHAQDSLPRRIVASASTRSAPSPVNASSRAGSSSRQPPVLSPRNPSRANRQSGSHLTAASPEIATKSIEEAGMPATQTIEPAAQGKDAEEATIPATEAIHPVAQVKDAEPATTSLSQQLDQLEREMDEQDRADQDDEGGLDMFDEPEDFRPKTPPPTVTHYEFPGTSSKVVLNLVGAHPLWGHLAWNASFILADFLCAHALTLTKGKKVLELGAAAGLPSIVCNWASASHVVATDYPDNELINNLTKNVEYNCQDEASPLKGSGKTFVEGYVWGRDPSSLLAHLPSENNKAGRFDLILLSDLVFNHQAHPALLETCDTCLSTEAAATSTDGSITTPCVLVFFTHHRPHLAYKDMQFFDMAEVKGWKFEKLGEWYKEPMFPEDPGDEIVRSTIHGYRLWRA